MSTDEDCPDQLSMDRQREGPPRGRKSLDKSIVGVARDMTLENRLERYLPRQHPPEHGDLPMTERFATDRDAGRALMNTTT